MEMQKKKKKKKKKKKNFIAVWHARTRTVWALEQK